MIFEELTEDEMENPIMHFSVVLTKKDLLEKIRVIA